MVDRIVPSTTDDDRKLVIEATGLWDAWPVMTEPFSQWVIEDRFSSGRPPFETVGAQLVSDVRPFELMKLRMLNGSHSTLAYLGYLAGYEFVSDAIADPAFRSLIYDLMTKEVMPTLPAADGDLAALSRCAARPFRELRAQAPHLAAGRLSGVRRRTAASAQSKKPASSSER